MNLKEKAEKLFNEVCSIVPCEPSFHETEEEADLKIKNDILVVKEICNYIITNEYKSNRELLFNLRSVKVIESEKVYLHRINESIQEEELLKQEIEKL